MKDLKKTFMEHQIKTTTEADIILWAGNAVESSGSLAEAVPDLVISAEGYLPA